MNQHARHRVAAEHHEVFNAYQQTQKPREEKMMMKAKHVAAFIGGRPGRALFTGVYENCGSVMTSGPDRLNKPGFQELITNYGLKDVYDKQRFFNPVALPVFQKWTSRLGIHWSPPDRVWARWAGRNDFPIILLSEDSQLTPRLPAWRNLVLSHAELDAIPESWKSSLAEWRGVCFILDTSDGKGYAGAAYGKENLLGRWKNYAKSGHGGNKKLIDRDPGNFRYSILEQVSPDSLPEDVIELEKSWKDRLHTREHGLNDN